MLTEPTGAGLEEPLEDAQAGPSDLRAEAQGEAEGEHRAGAEGCLREPGGHEAEGLAGGRERRLAQERRPVPPGQGREALLISRSHLGRHEGSGLVNAAERIGLAAPRREGAKPEDVDHGCHVPEGADALERPSEPVDHLPRALVL